MAHGGSGILLSPRASEKGPLWQPALNVASNGAEGYEYWFHRELDARKLTKA